MRDKFCICYHKAYVEYPVETWSSSMEFLATILVSLLGIYLNRKFLVKLKKERRMTPVGRKGNVIDPIMRWFLGFQIIYWPYNLLYHWVTSNGLLSSELLPTWLCYSLPYSISIGRQIIAYNSLFVALIRYIYIVHQTKANQWSFKVLGKLLRNLSIAIPLGIFVVAVLLDQLDFIKAMPAFESCMMLENASNNSESLNPIPVKMALKYLPRSLHIVLHVGIQMANFFVFLNIPEAFLYFSIFKTMKR